MKFLKWGLYLLVLCLGLGVGLVVASLFLDKQSIGSVQRSEAYYSTSTANTVPGTYYFTANDLGSVVITSSTGVSFTVLDADGSGTTTTIAIFNSTAAEGTYTFDRYLVNGLAFVFSATSSGNITFTYRQ